MAKPADPDLSKPLFTDRESFEAWLKGKPKDWAVDLATRSALRTGVMLWPVQEPDAPSTSMANLLLQSHRALFILHTPSGDYTERKRAALAAFAAADDAARAAARAAAAAGAAAAADAAYAAFAAASAASSAVDARAASAASARAAAAAARAANATATARAAWTELEQEARYLSHNDQRSRLLSSPLWRARPSWVDQRFERARQTAAAQSPFNFCLAWYRGVLIGKVPNSVISRKAAQDLAFAEGAFWTPDEKRPADRIMREICTRAGWDWEKAIVEPLPPVERRAEDTLREKAPPAPPPQASTPTVTSKRTASDTTQQELSSETESPEPDSETPQPERQSDPEIHLTDSADIQHDNPTLKDELGRSPFVEVMVDRLQSLHSDQLKRGQGFAINLHAPWGAGKSTILKMMEAWLTTDRRFKDRWIVVNFNAWEHEHRKPPWWPLICAFRKQICKTLGEVWELKRADWIRMRWFSWRLLSDWLPYTVLGVLVTVAVTMLTLGVDFSRWETVLKIVAPTLAFSVALIALLRGVVFGSPENAKAFFSLRDNPITKFSEFFKTLVALPKRPICVFIDDLDRCDADYVVELLEGIQTAFRHPNVVYVVAADRKWIKSAFEHRYKDAFAQVEGMGQPLGYLFLEKIFQLSTPLPAPTHNAQRRYWQKLLGEDGAAQSPARQPTPQQLRELREQAQSRIATADTYEEIEAVVEQSEASEDSEALQDEIRSAAFERASRSETIEREAKHRLAQLSTIIPFNPRNMKRLLNTYTLRVGEGFSGGVKPEVLARWVVLEHSYPELTDLLAEQPDLAKHFQKGARKLKDLPPLVLECRDRKQVSEIFWKTVEGVSAPLTVEDVRKLTRAMV